MCALKITQSINKQTKHITPACVSIYIYIYIYIDTQPYSYNYIVKFERKGKK